MFDGLQQRDHDPITFGEPGDTTSFAQTARNVIGDFGAAGPAVRAVKDIVERPQDYADIVRSSYRQTALVDSMTARNNAIEAAYDQRIATIKDTTGVALDNPERLRLTERDLRRINRDGLTDPVEWKRQQFDRQVSALKDKNPDHAEALTFGDVTEQARGIAAGAEQGAKEAAGKEGLNPVASTAAGFAGGLGGQARDPLFLGSLFAGPTGALGKQTITRILSSGFFQGLYNMGITALEQPAVQQWRKEAGLRSGVEPAAENVGMAFLFGAIPGAVFRGLGEAATASKVRPAMERILRGAPEPGDVAIATKALGEHLSPVEQSAVRMGEDMQAADRVAGAPPAKGVPSDLHDDLSAAALRRADDPTAPSPQAVAAVQHIEAWHGSPHDFDAFSMGKIGTGEGAASYGHGLYFAENRAVAADYAQKLSMPKVMTADGMRIGDLRDANVYKVNIKADREHLLDWDKPLSEQSEFVQQAVKGLEKKIKVGWLPTLENDLQDIRREQLLNAKTGQDLLSALERGTSREEATRILKEAGIPGIRYLDQGSRPTPGFLEDARRNLDRMKERGDPESIRLASEHVARLEAVEPTRNFVMFDDKLVEITEKNGRPVAPDAALQARIAEAQPRNAAEAAQAADEALDDFGRKQGMDVTRRYEAEQGEIRQAAAAAHVEATGATPLPKDDILGAIPWTDKKGNADTITAAQAGRLGARESELEMLIRSCK